MVEVHRDLLSRVYRARRCSGAWWFSCCAQLATIVLPFVLAYSSHGFWMKDNTFFEQPDSRFKHAALVQLDGENGGNPMALQWSSDGRVNELYGDSLREATIRASEKDSNTDGVTDTHTIHISVPLGSAEHVYRATVLLFFDVSLSQRSSFRMDAVASLNLVSGGVPLTGAQYDADLVFSQRSALPAGGPERTPYSNQALFDPLAMRTHGEASVGAVLAQNTERDHIITLEREQVLYSLSSVSTVDESTNPGEVDVTIRLRIPKSAIWYTPDTAEVLKFAWVQYVSVAILVWYGLSSLASAVFRKQIFESRVVAEGVGSTAQFKLHRF